MPTSQGCLTAIDDKTPIGTKVQCIKTWKSQTNPNQNYGVVGEVYTIRDLGIFFEDDWRGHIRVEEIQYTDDNGSPLYVLLNADRFKVCDEMSQQPDKPIVVVHIDQNGEHHVHFSGEVDVFYVDSNCKSEPIYKLTAQQNAAALREIIGDGPWPNSSDDRHAVVEASINAMKTGKPLLRLV